MTGPHDTVAEQLNLMVSEFTSQPGVSRMAAVRHLRDELARIEAEAVKQARSEGATWQQVADDLGFTSRQGAQSKFSGDTSMQLPGMSAAEMARRLGIHHQTVASNPEKHGIIVKTYAGEAGGHARKRYFLPGDEATGKD
jgi:hypothetical protein